MILIFMILLLLTQGTFEDEISGRSFLDYFLEKLFNRSFKNCLNKWHLEGQHTQPPAKPPTQKCTTTQPTTIAEPPSKGNIDEIKCKLNDTLKKEIHNYESVVNSIIYSVVHGRFKGIVYDELAKFVDTFGYRMTGTDSLEMALDYLFNLMKLCKLDDVHDEPVTVPHWTRGKETAEMILPRYQTIQLPGFFGSVGTPEDGISASVIVVKSFDELYNRSLEASGKIVICNQDLVKESDIGKYGSECEYAAATIGAVAALVRSPFRVDLRQHSGLREDSYSQIPIASISAKDADMFRRLTERGINVVVRMYMEAKSLPDIVSRNVIGDLRGSLHREKVVLLSGHVDSWDVGPGIFDDAAGAFVSGFSVCLLKNLGLRSKRTIRSAIWTANKQGFIGVQEYVKTHRNKLKNLNLVMEPGKYITTPRGVEFAGSEEAACIMYEITKLMEPLKATQFNTSDIVGSDIIQFQEFNVPAATTLTEEDKSSRDDTKELDRTVAMFAAIAYVVADLSEDLPREKLN